MSIREKLSFNHDFARKKYIKNDVMILTKALKIRYTLMKVYLVEIWRWARIQLKRQKVVPSGCPRKKIGRKNPEK